LRIWRILVEKKIKQQEIKFGTLSLIAALACAFLVGGCSKDEKTNAEQSNKVVIKIGNVAPLTGPDSYLGKDNENGARLAIEDVNKQGLTINGKTVVLELIGEDDAGDATTGTKVATKLVDNKVAAVVGHLNSGVSIPASKIYSEAGITQITPSSTNPELTLQGFKTTYRMVGTDAQQAPVLAHFVVENLKGKTIAVVDDATQYGKGLADEFEKTLNLLGQKVILREATNNKASDFKAILTNIKAKKPDVILFGGMAATGGPFAKQAQELGITAKVIGGDGICSPSLYDLAGEAVNNVICSTVGVPLEKLKGSEDYIKKYKERFKVDVQIYSPMAYDAVMVIVDAMKRANSTDAKDILAAMPTTNYSGLTGQIAFDSKGDLKESFITLNQYKDKKIGTLQVMKMQ